MLYGMMIAGLPQLKQTYDQAIPWFLKAAQTDAQVSLAEYLLRDFSSQDAVAGALVWIERAERQGNSSAKLLLAAILAAHPDAQRRDPQRALQSRLDAYAARRTRTGKLLAF